MDGEISRRMDGDGVRAFFSRQLGSYDKSNVKSFSDFQ
jgi:hypothetical protein